MIKKIEFFRFTKKPHVIMLSSTKETHKRKNYSLIKGKEYSQLFISILNSSNNTIKPKLNNKNSIKKITLCKPEELKINHIYTSQNIFNSSINNPIIIKNYDDINATKKNIDINKQFFLYKNGKKKLKKTETEIRLDKKKVIKNVLNKKVFNKNKNLKEIKSQNKTEKNIIIHKELQQKLKDDVELNKLKNSKKKKNDIKIKKIKILKENNFSYEIDKDKLKKTNLNNKFRYILKKKFKNNYKIQKSPNLNIINKNKKIINKTTTENKRKKVIKDSLHIMDSFINNNYIENEYYKFNSLDNNYKKKTKTYIKNYCAELSNITHSMPKFSNNDTERNTMNSTKIIDIQSPFEFNKYTNRKIKTKLDSFRNKKNLISNSSEYITIKINQKFEKERQTINKIKENFINKRKKYLELNINNKSNIKRIVRMKIRNINMKKKERNPKKYVNHNIYNDLYSCDEDTYTYKAKRYYSFSKKNNSKKESISLSKERDIRKRNHESIKDNFDNIEKKLLNLINNFHNKVHSFDEISFNFSSGKLIDRIRTKKKLGNI
jgi:hypothetical protein